MKEYTKYLSWLIVSSLLWQHSYTKELVTSQGSYLPTQDLELSRNIEGYIIFLNVQPLDSKSRPKNFDPNLVIQLAKMFYLEPVRIDLIQKHERYFLQYSEYFDQTFLRGAPYMHFIVNEVTKRKMPGEIALLPFIESRFTPSIKSHAGAKGIWQFMPATGKKYGLDLTNLYDGRDDFYAATLAALDYLQYLYNLFHDWSLAIAAYNAGENRVQRAIDEARVKGLEATFDNLRLPKETTNYVAKLLAVRNVIRDYKIGSLSLVNKPYFEKVKINHPISLQTVAKLANVPLSQIQHLNPSYKAAIYTPNSNRNLLIPKSSYRRFFDNYNRMIKNKNFKWYALKVKEAQSTIQLAQILNTSVAELQSYNNLFSETIPAGKTVFFKVKNNSNSMKLLADKFLVVSLKEFESPETITNRVERSSYHKLNTNYSRAKVDTNNSGIIKVSNNKVTNKKVTNKKVTNKNSKLANKVKKKNNTNKQCKVKSC